MPRKKSAHAPSMRLHKPSGQAVVTIDGKDFYLGRYDAPDSKRKYDRMIAEWYLRGRQGPQAAAPGSTIAQLIAGYLEHRASEGIGPSHQKQIRIVMRILNEHYGDICITDFGPMQLKALRQKMTQMKCRNFGREGALTLSRNYVNGMVVLIKDLFRWGAEVEIVPQGVYGALLTVKPFGMGKGGREGAKVKPADISDIDAVLELATPIMRGILELQLLTGARIGEICQLRAIDIDTRGRVWKFTPEHHKTEKKGFSRVVLIGPRGQEIVKRFLKPDLHAYLFTPAEGHRNRVFVQERNGKPFLQQRHYSGTSRCTSGNFRERYYADAICSQLVSLVKRADALAHARNPKAPPEVPLVRRWHTHQLRHLRATYLRSKYGIDVAQVVLGHANLATTEEYAETDTDAAEEAIFAVG